MKPDKNTGKKPSTPAGGGKDRNYDKPWLAPEKKPKKEASSFIEYHYPDGADQALISFKCLTKTQM